LPHKHSPELFRVPNELQRFEDQPRIQTPATDVHRNKQTMQRMQLLLYIAVRTSLQHQLLVRSDWVQATVDHAVAVHELAGRASGHDTLLTPVPPLPLTLLCANACQKLVLRSPMNSECSLCCVACSSLLLVHLGACVSR
jgi:hypothetical protein